MQKMLFSGSSPYPNGFWLYPPGVATRDGRRVCTYAVMGLFFVILIFRRMPAPCTLCSLETLGRLELPGALA